MNTEQLAAFIENPHLLTANEIPALRQLSNKHPYSSAIHLLYVAAIARFQSIDLDDVLSDVAFQISDRSRLYHLIHNDEPISETLIPSVKEEVSQIEETPLIELNTTEVLVKEIEIIELETKEEPLVEEQQLEEEFLFDFEKQPSILQTDYFSEISDQNSKNKKDSTEKTEEKVSIDSSQKTFVAWLKSGEDKASTIEKTTTSEIKTVQSYTEQLTTKKANEKANELIAKYIETDPKLAKPTQEFYKPSEKAKESVDENAIPVSETLARIYEKQGNFPKAIHIYHQLSLANPEKKSFFASRIEDLKKKITE
jgi:tetratricopeptide (TPR) repeat protein